MSLHHFCKYYLSLKDEQHLFIYFFFHSPTLKADTSIVTRTSVHLDPESGKPHATTTTQINMPKLNKSFSEPLLDVQFKKSGCGEFPRMVGSVFSPLPPPPEYCLLFLLDCKV